MDKAHVKKLTESFQNQGLQDKANPIIVIDFGADYEKDFEKDFEKERYYQADKGYLKKVVKKVVKKKGFIRLIKVT